MLIILCTTLLTFGHLAVANIESNFDAHQLHHGEDGEMEHHLHMEPQDTDNMEWEKLNQKQRDTAMQKFFNRLDLDQDGELSNKELQQAIAEEMMRENKVMANRAFAESDENKDGKVTFSEYLEDMHEEIIQDSELEEFRFKTADVDNSGTLENEEFFAFYYPYEFEHMKEYLKKGVLDYFDADTDGFLSKDEFEQASTEVEDFDESEEDFHQADTNGDGQLDEQELLALLSLSGARVADEEVQWIREEVEAQHADKLTLDECMRHSDIFAYSHIKKVLLEHHEEL